MLLARRPAELERVATACAARGVSALAVPTDVTDPGAVADAARRAVARFGRLVSSLYGQVAQPYGAAHSMSRAAVRSMAAALRQELRLGRVRGVAVTTMLAPSVDTPLHRVAANHSGRAVRPMRPIYPAERVAATILRQLRRPRLEVVAGGPLAKALTHGHALVPGLTEWLVAEEARRSLRGPGRGAPRTGVDGVPATSGNLYRPASEPGTASGD